MSMSSAPYSPVLTAPPREAIYTGTFWLAYAANVVLVMANALSFQFAEWVDQLGGSQQLAGSIISAGLIGVMLARLGMGQFIDRYGAGRLWSISAVCFIGGCTAFALIDTLGWPAYAARLMFSISLAGLFTSSIVHIQNQVPAHRRTEVIGNLGSSGFVGMIAGSLLGDYFFRTVDDPQLKFQLIFGTAALLGVVHLVIALMLTWGHAHEPPAEHVSALRLLIRYWPGPVVAVAIMMGVSFGVTTVFLRRFATVMPGLSGIGTFFTAYALSAFVFRISTSQWSQRMGRHAMIVRGLSGHFVAMSSLCFVTQEWHFIIPAVAGGFGHALLFPAVVSLGAGAFPKRYRGLGTTLTLGFVEAGTMLSAPILGAIIDRYYGAAELKYGFVPMFAASAVMMVAVAVYYRLTAASQPDIDRPHDEDLAEEWGDPAPAEPRDEVAVPFPHLGRNS